MPDIEAMSPVYFARKQMEGEMDEDYNTAISQNENLLNQNLKILYDAISDLNAKYSAVVTNK